MTCVLLYMCVHIHTLVYTYTHYKNTAHSFLPGVLLVLLFGMVRHEYELLLQKEKSPINVNIKKERMLFSSDKTFFFYCTQKRCKGT